MHPKTITPLKVRFEFIEKVEKLDDYSVRFTLKRPVLNALAKFSFKIIPKHGPKNPLFLTREDPFVQQPIGTGPYILKNITADREIVMVANDGFVKNLHAVKTTHYTAMMRAGGVPLRPGIKQLINDARKAGITLAIATTTSPENVGALLEVGLGKDWESYFASVGCGDIVPLKKPAPDIYNWVLDEIKLPAADCIALEDSNNGLRSSLAAGIKTYITINHYTRNQDFTGAAGVFDDLSNLSAFYKLSGLTLP